jgi:Holliday junction resolvasome RuvABC endonuclease subunit
MKIIALGFDPGSKHTGWAVYDGDQAEWGVWEAEGDQLLPLVSEQVKRIKPNVIGIEKLELHSEKFGNMSRAKHIYMTSLKVAKACAQIEALAYFFAVPIVLRTKSAINRELAGYAHIKKANMQQLVQRYLELREPIRPQHANDAMAIAIIAYNHRQINQRLRPT